MCSLARDHPLAICCVNTGNPWGCWTATAPTAAPRRPSGATHFYAGALSRATGPTWTATRCRRLTPNGCRFARRLRGRRHRSETRENRGSCGDTDKPRVAPWAQAVVPQETGFSCVAADVPSAAQPPRPDTRSGRRRAPGLALSSPLSHLEKSCEQALDRFDARHCLARDGVQNSRRARRGFCGMRCEARAF